MKFQKSWKALPANLRKAIALVIGSTSIVLGALLIVLPGPFTIPFVVFGLMILSIEFVWAESLLIKVKHHAKKRIPRKRSRRP